MTLIEYIIATKILILKSNGKILGTWHANSGGIDKSLPLPTGRYTVGVKPQVDELKLGMPKGFNMSNEKGFFIALMPKFHTPRGKVGEGRFGIHPDGGASGTHGCIGISRYASTFLSLYRKYRPTILIVK